MSANIKIVSDLTDTVDKTKAAASQTKSPRQETMKFKAPLDLKNPAKHYLVQLHQDAAARGRVRLAEHWILFEVLSPTETEVTSNLADEEITKTYPTAEARKIWKGMTALGFTHVKPTPNFPRLS